MKLILLGSGAVRPDLEHWGPAQVVQVGGKNLLFDCGRGASMRLLQAGIPLESIERTFFTHHHYDHNCDFAYLFLTSWVLGRKVPMQVVGPRGTEAFCDGLFNRVYRDDMATRRGHRDEAVARYSEALDLFRQVESREGIASVCHNLSNISFSMGDHRRCLELALETRSIAKEMGIESLQSSTDRLLLRLQSSIGEEGYRKLEADLQGS